MEKWTWALAISLFLLTGYTINLHREIGDLEFQVQIYKETVSNLETGTSTPVAGEPTYTEMLEWLFSE